MNNVLKGAALFTALTAIAASVFIIYQTTYPRFYREVPGPSDEAAVIEGSEENVSGEHESAPVTVRNGPASIEEDEAGVIDVEREFKRAADFLKAGRYEDAIMSFGKVVDSIPDAYIGIGTAYYSLKRYEEARDYFERYLEGHDGFPARKALANIYYMRNDLDNARYHAGKGLELRDEEGLRSLYDKIGKDIEAQQDYIKDVSSHFDIYYDGYAQNESGREIIEILESAYSEVGQALGYFPSESISVIMYTNREFHDVTDAPSWSGGVYDGKIRIPVKGVDPDAIKVKKVLYHEYVHTLVYSITVHCPAWLNEGLAEYFENGPSGKGKEVVPLDELERPFTRINPENVIRAYEVSRFAVTRLINKYGMYRIKTLLSELSPGAQFRDAFFSAYPVSFEEFRRQWAEEGR